MLCALKCDLREEQEKEDENAQPAPPTIQYKDGLEAAKTIGALRYLGMSKTLKTLSITVTDDTRMLCHA